MSYKGYMGKRMNTIRTTKNREESSKRGQEIAKLYRAKYTAGMIAKKLGVSRQTVYYYLQRYGVERRVITDYFGR